MTTRDEFRKPDPIGSDPRPKANVKSLRRERSVVEDVPKVIRIYRSHSNVLETWEPEDIMGSDLWIRTKVEPADRDPR